MAAPGISPTRICILLDSPGVAAFSEHRPYGGWETSYLEGHLRQAGLEPHKIHFETISPSRRVPTKTDWENCVKRLNNLSDCNVLVTFGEASLHFSTGKRGIDKWQASPLDAVRELKVRKVIPTFSFRRVQADYSLRVYHLLAFTKAKEEQKTRDYLRKPRKFRMNPKFDDAISLLRLGQGKEKLAIDIETGRGQINTFGFAWSKHDGVAIKVLPDAYGHENFFLLWNEIRKLLEGPSKKILQNNPYENQWFSSYGIRMNNVWHDTMWAMKFLWPELEKGLGNVGRFYTDEPYWKDEGKVASEEGNKKDWGNIRDWQAHFRYNCLDTTGTFEAAERQRSDLQARGLLSLWEEYISRLADPLNEMTGWGLPVSEEHRAKKEQEVSDEIEQMQKSLSQEINLRSPKQKLEFLKGKGFKIPKVRSGNTFRESTNELSLKKLRMKHPNDSDLKIMLDFLKKNKLLTSYLRAEYDREKGTVHYSFDGHGTETGRFSCRKDAFDKGFNAQTLGKDVKKFIRFPDSEDRWFLQVDLKQAESRFVAYDSCDTELIRMIEDPNEDVHKYVASNIVEKPVEEITYEQRQLGKKSGHGANYLMGAGTFQEACLKEMDLVLSKKEAEAALEGYHKAFPKIRPWQESIKREVRRTRTLRNPLGRVRQFWGRLDDNTFREAVAYKPQSTIPDITNFLMLALLNARTEGVVPDFRLHLQVHDSLVISCRKDALSRISSFMLDTDLWHPEIILPAGRLVIPTECEVGKSLGELEEYTP